MDIIIQSPGFKASEALESFTREKLNKLSQHSDKIIRADVTLSKGPEGRQDNNYCEIRLEVAGNDHFAKKNGNSFELAITETIHAVQHMLEKSRDKENSHRHPDPVIE
ncbi:MAG: hypothetical protein JWQ38_94 [Flavipsychrobacter sp.]|nr:hypothetical protein [Flavipsychrobacter sp.]